MPNSSKPEPEKSKNKRAVSKRLLFLIAGIVLLAVAVLLVVFASNDKTSSNSDTSTAYEDSLIEYNGQIYEPKENIYTVLVEGIDTFTDNEKVDNNQLRNYEQADFLALVVLDRDTNEARMVMINRDTMTEIPDYDAFGKWVGTQTAQLALAHTYGSGQLDSARNVATSVSSLLGDADIDAFISITMDGVAAVNDAVGGVPVLIEDDFSSIDKTLKKNKVVTLKGDQALTFVRARQSVSDGTNLARIHRQEVYLASLFEKLKEMDADSSSFYTELLTNVSPYMESSVTVAQLSSLMKELQNSTVSEIEQIPGEAKKGEVYMEFYPDEEGLQELIVSLFYEPVEES